jgi:excisionase family DNA binding protein
MALLVTDGATHDLNVREFARETGTSERLVWTLVARGEIRTYRLGRVVRIPRGELERLRRGTAA